MPSDDMIYVMENKSRLEDKYSGKYIAIFEKKVVAVGRTLSEVYKVVRNMKIKSSLVMYIPKEGEEALLI